MTKYDYDEDRKIIIATHDSGNTEGVGRGEAAELLNESVTLKAAMQEYLAVLDDRGRMEREYPAGTCNADDAWRDYDAREKAAMARIRELVA